MNDASRAPLVDGPQNRERPRGAVGPLRTVGAAFVIAALAASCSARGDPGNPLPGSSKLAGGTILHAFGGPGAPMQDGAEPKGTLTAVTVDGKVVLFGRTAVGGIRDCGIIFAINPDGSGYDVRYRFRGSDGCDPRHDAMVLNPNDGKLYGATLGINQSDNKAYGSQGHIHAFKPDAPLSFPIPIVKTFTGEPGAGQQHSSFSIDPVTGFLYGQSAFGGKDNKGLLYAVRADGTDFVSLHDFKKSTGSHPHGRIVLHDGVLYGVTRSDGDLPGGRKKGHGVVFSYPLVSPPTGGPYTVLHTFAGAPNDGALSDHGYLTPVTIGSKTILFGLTQCGGTGRGKDACAPSDGGGAGTVYQIDPGAPPGSRRAFSIVHSFQGRERGDGAEPYGSLMYDGTYLFGTTSAGGLYGKGTVFRIRPVAFGAKATPTLLHHFGADANAGAKPIDNVIKVGNTLYGLTVYGGLAAGLGNGTVFAIPLPN
jgi:uncharacterized repeat protein (TIGR03803 family)